MTTRLLHRPPRSVTPLTRPEPTPLAAPPAITTETGGRTPMMVMLPVVGAMSSMVMMVVLRNGQPLFLVIAAVVFLVAVVAGIAIAIATRGQQRKQNRQRRELYLDYLEKTRADLSNRATDARTRAQDVHPAPSSLVGIATDPARVWDRRPTDPDFLTVRLGTGPVPWFGLTLEPEPPLEPYDPMLAAEARRLIDQHRSTDGFPVLADLADTRVVTIVGDHAEATATARALLLRLAVTHSPEHLLLAAALPPEVIAGWQGLDLLPHLHDPRLFDGPVPARRVAPDLHELMGVIGTEIADRLTASARRAAPDLPRLLVVTDDHGRHATPLPLPPGATLAGLGVTVVHLLADPMHEPSDVDLRLTLGERPTLTRRPGTLSSDTQPLVPDTVTAPLAEAVTRHLAPLRLTLAVNADEEVSTTTLDIDQILGISGTETISPAVWRPRAPEDFLRVAFATDDLGGPVRLDLKESAQGGMGPHGICVGATGSGKSEMLRTLILSLALAHSPDDLSMILVDYKGGAAFSPFATLPHLAGLIDNLAEDPQLTTRARASLQGEVVRRQRLLKEADCASVTHYRQLRDEGADLPPLPHLFVIIDEFGELLTAEPDFIDLFLQIGRIGRSIGVHLLLSSQRIEGGKLRGLDTYLSYRLGLRTFSAEESQTVLGTSDAFSLPSLPGYGYLKVDTSVYTRFRAGYVSGAVHAAPAVTAAGRPAPMLVPTYNHIAARAAEGAAPGPTTPRLTRIDTGPSLVSEAVARLRDDDRRVRPVWLPPLPSRLALGHVVDPDARADAQADATRLLVPLGLVDDPARQAQDPWTLDLARAGGHVAVIGAPQSGRTTLLRTLAASIALTRTPKDVAVYGMDLTGGGLARIEGFPHVGGVAVRAHHTRLTRLLEEITAMLTARESVVKQHSIESMAHLRTLHASGQIPKLASADVVLLLDGYGQLRSDFSDLEEPLLDLITRGPGLGIHVVLAMTRWGDLRMAHQALFGTRLELRLGDPADSVVDRKLAATLSPDTPGRALVEGGLLAQTALPVLDLVDDDQVGPELVSLAAQVTESWDGPSAAPIRLLPHHVDPASLSGTRASPDMIPLGIRQDTMAVEHWDLLDQDQHLIVLGDAKSGKSTLLRTIAAGLATRYTEDELAIAVLDTRGHTASVLPVTTWAAAARTLPQARGTAVSIATELDKRPSMDPDLRGRAPRIVVLVDDHDILTAGGADPLQPLLPHLPGARDLDLHLVIARPVAGAARALYSPVLQTVRDTGAALLLLSGDRSEGPIIGRTYAEQQPPGRGRYIRRGTPPFIIQTANTPPGGAA
ncbi:MAG: type VII secretion protein EccCa [Micrococcales bacterium]|nr:type VII secretion protein EccCa [Micrococcales bacterium]